jgi:putative ABC transport system permease protein
MLFTHARQSMKLSLRALLGNKLRSFLTMLGIIIGVGAVIVIISVGAGAQSLILAQFKSFGSDLIGILPGKSDDKGPPASAMGIVITTLTYDDALKLGDKRKVPGAAAVAAYSKGVANLSWQGEEYDTDLTGTTANFIEVEGGEVQNGRFFSLDEERGLARVAVLGSKAASELFGATDPVGKTMKLNKRSFEVIGVMKERGTVAFQNADDQALIPVSTAQKLILGVNHLGYIRVKMAAGADNNAVIADISSTLREQHDIRDSSGASDDFTIRSLSEAITAITTVTDALKYFLAAMAAISLLVGGIGIMNIMLVSVTERTREIGLRKAVGAKVRTIMAQFLMEAVVVTAVGGLIGIAGGTLISFLVAIIAQALGYKWAFEISFVSIFLGAGVSTAVGIVFGIYPARKAAKLNPIEALRYE